MRERLLLRPAVRPQRDVCALVLRATGCHDICGAGRWLAAHPGPQSSHNTDEADIQKLEKEAEEAG